MKNRRINGTQLERMLKNGVNNLMLHEQELNDLNVFPVPDGDTGTNMLKTLGNGMNHTRKNRECGLYLRELGSAMLLSARGNSGVILSQIFSGFAQEVGKCPLLGPGELRNALVRGYKNAYAITVKPVEGTILTVSREGIEHIRRMITRHSYIEEILAMYIAEMRKSLDNTPKMLAPLKDAGVVDSGALGYIYIFEGMLKYLYGEIIEADANEENAQSNAGSLDDIAGGSFNEFSDFADGYCMEFVLQLMRGDKYSQRFRLSSFTEDLNYYGNSLVVVQDGQRVKVHIHTFKPAKIMSVCQEYGEFLTFKLDNMQLQHNQRDNRVAAQKARVKFAVVAVSFGDGMSKLFKQLGCANVIECPKNMGISSEEFIRVAKKCNADTVVILPNDGNLIKAAEQAAELNKDSTSNIVVLPSKSPADGYFALAMDIQDGTDYKLRISQMNRGLENVVTLSEVTCAKDYAGEKVVSHIGEEVVLINDTPVGKGADRVEALITGLSNIENVDELETAILFRGSNVDASEEELIRDAVEQRYPLLEMTFVYGGQDTRNWIVGFI